MSAIYHSPWYVYDRSYITSLISLPTFGARVSLVSSYNGDTRCSKERSRRPSNSFSLLCSTEALTSPVAAAGQIVTATTVPGPLVQDSMPCVCRTHDTVNAPPSTQCKMVDGVGLLACHCNSRVRRRHAMSCNGCSIRNT